MSKFVIKSDVTKKVRRFNLQGRHIEFRLKDVPDKVEPVPWIREGIREIIQHGVSNVDSNDLVGISFCSKEFTRSPGWVNLKRAADLKWNDVWDLLLKIYQSNSKGIHTESFCLGVTSVRPPTGGGRGRNYLTFEEECSKRRGIVTVNNKDNLCLPRALVVGRANADKNPEYSKIRRDVGKIQTSLTHQLLKESGVAIPEQGGGIPELQAFQNYFENKYKITVYKYGSKGREVIFEGSDAPLKINLLYHEQHYNVITSLTAAFCCTYFCELCHVPYEYKDKHRCGKSCPCCRQTPPCQEVGNEITCGDCNRAFRGQACFDAHKLGTACLEIKRCSACLKTYNMKLRKGKAHVCGEIYCRICADFKPSGHFCYIQPDTRKPDTKDMIYIFYDPESRLESDNVHRPNLCVLEQVCDVCINDDSVTVCSKCGLRRQILRGDKCIEGFILYLLEAKRNFKKVIVIAHNGQAYDHQFILNYILTSNLNIKPDLIMRGTKILLMQLDNIKFLDSLNYFPMALAALPKAFDLGTEFKKGYFPYLFNTQTNQNYVGVMPELKYFDPDHLKPEALDALKKWHAEHKADCFDFQKELVEYCVSDVQILKAACLKFRDMFLKECNVEPFAEAVTIASACNLVYRRNFLTPNTIGIIPKNGYRLCDNQSKIALQWLLWEEHQRGIMIQSAARGRETNIGGFKVDGFCPETNQIFEFHGCFYHEHSCLKYNRNNPLHDDPEDTLNTRFERTCAKTHRLRALGYEVIEMWECEFRCTLNQNREIQEYVEQHEILQNLPLQARDAFAGGRTETIKLRHEAQSGEEIHYKDFCSLYPWVCKYGKFPIGHPDIFVGHENCMPQFENAEGLIKCTILPPQNLLHPVLPMKMNNKLLFALCYTCAKTLNQGKCLHSEVERALSGTWVIDEVRKAVEKGYKILKINEIWKYKIAKFEKGVTTGLFSKFINKFLKLKQQASGFPSECTTYEERNAYIEMFMDREDVQLEFDKIVKNSGMRSFAKLMLNSFWGKFGQRENQPQTEIINDPAALYALLTNPSINVCHIEPINEMNLIVNWEYKEETYAPLSTVNVAIAAFTTAQARLKLYEEIDKLGDRVLYGDTDSVIYVSRENTYEPSSGNYLGELTDELEDYGVGSYITKFVSGGPKTYAYTVYTPETNKFATVCKFKGITLTERNLEKVNMDVLESLILNEDEGVVVTGKNFRRTADHVVTTREETKTFKATFNKRKRAEDFGSVPYGYKKTHLT